MPNVSFDTIVLGGFYTRDRLAKLWKYKGSEALNRSLVTPRGTQYIILFVTGNRPGHVEQYEDELKGSMLYWEGQAAHGSDMRLVQAESETDTIHLFYREEDRTDFCYYGVIKLAEFELYSAKGTGSKFIFFVPFLEQATEGRKLLSENSVREGVRIRKEGERKKYLVERPERDPRLKFEALQIHGKKCKGCLFDFDAFYGAQYANGYIEMHHVTPLREGEQWVDPETDLIPLCANCHRVVHRYKDKALSLEELHAAIAQQKK